jgi:hypothetical protein
MAVAGDDRVGAGEVELCTRYLQSVLRSVTHTAKMRGVPIIVGLEKHHTLLQSSAEYKTFTYTSICHRFLFGFYFGK